MFQYSFYDAIFKSKSTRTYENEKLAPSELEKINIFAQKLTPLYTNITTQVSIVSPDKIKSIMPLYAPQYIVFYSETKEGYLENAGYMLQQLYLYLMSKNLGACWVASAKPTSKIESSGLKHIVNMAFGSAANAQRKKVSHFKRKPLNKICDFEHYENYFEAARLAPSSRNSQPWFFTKTEKGFHAYARNENPVEKYVMKAYHNLDVGIALCNITVAAKRYGKEINFFNDSPVNDIAVKGLKYIISFALE